MIYDTERILEFEKWLTCPQCGSEWVDIERTDTGSLIAACGKCHEVTELPETDR